MRTSNSKPISTRVDSVGARPRALSIWDAFLGCDRSRQVIRRHKLEWHIWMRHYQHHLDVPVLLEIGHALDQTGQDAPTELVGAAEQGRAELGSRFPEPANGSELDLFFRVSGDLGELLAQAVLFRREPVDGLPDERRVDPVAEPVQLCQLLLMEVCEPALQPGASFQARLLSVSKGAAQLLLERGCPQGVQELGTHHVHHELHEAVVPEPGPALLALPQDDHLPALAETLRRAHPATTTEN